MKISGRVVTTKPISLSRAAKLISRFAAVENGSSPAVSVYLQRTSDAFNQLVQFHSKNKNLGNLQTEIVAESELTSINNEMKKKKKRSGEDANKSGSKKSRVEALHS